MLYFEYRFSITEKQIKFEDKDHELLITPHINEGDLYTVKKDAEGRIMLVKLSKLHKLMMDI